MAKGKAEVSNFAVRVFLQRVGEHYDDLRGLPRYRKSAHFQEVLSAFDRKCCYCGNDLKATDASEDHLIPLNKTAMGLHCWGNVVPACRSCNAEKHGNDWFEFVVKKAGPNYETAAQRIRAFTKKYGYNPQNSELRLVADTLYEEVGELTMRLIELKIARAESIIDRMK